MLCFIYCTESVAKVLSYTPWDTIISLKEALKVESVLRKDPVGFVPLDWASSGCNATMPKSCYWRGWENLTLLQEHADDDPFGLYTDYMDKILNRSPGSTATDESLTAQVVFPLRKSCELYYMYIWAYVCLYIYISILVCIYRVLSSVTG